MLYQSSGFGEEHLRARSVLVQPFSAAEGMPVGLLFVDADNRLFEAVSNEQRFSGISPGLGVTGEEALTFFNSMTLSWSFWIQRCGGALVLGR
jgi:hypothetical protein